jgi:hypothetical protein
MVPKLGRSAPDGDWAAFAVFDLMPASSPSVAFLTTRSKPRTASLPTYLNDLP